MNIQPHLKINGVDSTTIQGLLITELPPVSKPMLRTRVEEIDGRDGDIVTPLGYSAYDKPLKIALTRNYDIDKVIEFFNSEGVVIFSNEPDKYYRFAIYEQIDFERLIRFRTAEINLHVQPFKFSTIEQEQVFTLGTSPNTIAVYNSGNTTARPVIKIVGSGNIGISLNGVSILSLDLGDISTTIIIDSEAMNAYALDGTLLNRNVTGNYDNIRLTKGVNEFIITGNATQFTINKYSRWL